MTISALALLMLPTAACTGDVVDIGTHADAAAPGGDMANAGDVDMAGAMNGGDGGTMAVKFDPTIEMDIETLGCPGCHANGQTPVLKNGDTANNYSAFSAMANMGENSPVLTAPLAGSADTAHPSKPFADKTDVHYQRWLSWIQAGNPKGP